jgi:hypothetical protein
MRTRRFCNREYANIRFLASVFHDDRSWYSNGLEWPVRNVKPVQLLLHMGPVVPRRVRPNVIAPVYDQHPACKLACSVTHTDECDQHHTCAYEVRLRDLPLDLESPQSCFPAMLQNGRLASCFLSWWVLDSKPNGHRIM